MEWIDEMSNTEVVIYYVAVGIFAIMMVGALLYAIRE